MRWHTILKYLQFPPKFDNFYLQSERIGGLARPRASSLHSQPEHQKFMKNSGGQFGAND